MADNLTDLQNIGAVVAARLAEVGVLTAEDLRALGPVAAYRRVQANYPDRHLPHCYYLYSLEAALRGVDWRSLTVAEKAELRKAARST